MIDGYAKAPDRGGQPAPAPNDGPSMHDLVAAQLRAYPNGVGGDAGPLVRALVARRALGLERYGTVLQASNGRDFTRDALDEAVDLVVYLRGALAECDQTVDPPRWLKIAYERALRVAAELARRVEERAA